MENFGGMSDRAEPGELKPLKFVLAELFKDLGETFEGENQDLEGPELTCQESKSV